MLYDAWALSVVICRHLAATFETTEPCLIYARGKLTCKPLISATLEFASNSSHLRFLEPPAPGHKKYNDIHDANFVRHTWDGLQAHG